VVLERDTYAPKRIEAHRRTEASNMLVSKRIDAPKRI